MRERDLRRPRLDEQHVVLVAHRQHPDELLLGEVGEPEIGLERTAVVREVDARIAHLAAEVAADLLVGHVVVDPRELLVVLEVDAELDREVVPRVLLVVDARLADREELLQVLVELRIGHGAHLVLGLEPIGYGRLADRLGSASRSATLAA